jgi:hypothetical protein
MTKTRFFFYIILVSELMLFLWIKTYNIVPRVIDNGLVLAGIVKFEESNIMSGYFYNAWTITSQVAAILLFFKINISLLSYLIFLFPILSLLFGCIYISNYFTNNEYVSSIIVFFIIIFEKHIGITDYPILFYHESNFGTIALSIVILIMGLLFRNKFGFSILFSIILIPIHLIIGAFSLSVIIIVYFLNYKLNKDLINFKTLKKYFLLGIFILLLSLIYYILNYKFYNFELNYFDYNIYLSKWDHHRTFVGYNYFFILISSSVVIFLIFFIRKADYNFGLMYVIVFSALSILLYLFRDLFYHIPLFNKLMVSRFSVIISIPILVIIFSIFYFYIQRYLLLKVNFPLYSIFFLMLILLFRFNFGNAAKTYRGVLYTKVNEFWHSRNDDSLFWAKVNDHAKGKNVLTTYSSTRPLLINSGGPYLLDVTSMDFIPYFPSSVTKLKRIVEDVYGIDFQNPPMVNVPSLSDVDVKAIFESRSIVEWNELAEAYNFNVVVVPSQFKLNLASSFHNEVFTCYIIN